MLRNNRRVVSWLFLSALLVLALVPTIRAGPAGNRLTVALDSDPPSLDGHENVLISGGIVLPHIYDKLVEFDMNSKIVPQLATEWKVSADGLTWTFTLRRGHKFHDGTPVNAAAVKASFDRMLDEKNPFYRRNLFDPIKRIAVVNENTIAFTTEKPTGWLLTLLANPTASVVSPTAAAKVDLKTFGLFPVGSGPWFFREWVRGTRIVVQKNRAHWAADKSNIDTIEFRPVPEDSARAVGLETGELQFVTTIAPQEAKRLQRNGKLAVYNTPRVRIQGVYVNVAKKPFSDARVRHAIAHAIDKKAIVDAFLAGFARVADSPLPAGVWPYKRQPGFEYNPDKAKRLLAEAGYPNGFPATMWVPVGTYVAAQQISEAIGEMLRKVGINVKMEIMESTQWLTLLRSKGPTESTLEMTYYGWGTHTADADYALRLVFHTENFAPKCCNRNFYSNAEVDRLLDQGLNAVSQAQRRTVYEKAQEIIWRDQPWIYIFAVNHSAVGLKRLTGVQLVPTEWIHFREANLE
jgi:glutathione transport system substrate-binding protein